MNEFSSHMFEPNFLEYLPVLGLFGFFHHFFNLVIVVNVFFAEKRVFHSSRKSSILTCIWAYYCLVVMIAQCKLDECIIQYLFFHLMDEFYNDAINMYT